MPLCIIKGSITKGTGMEEATATDLLEWHKNTQACNRTGKFVVSSQWSLDHILKS